MTISESNYTKMYICLQIAVEYAVLYCKYVSISAHVMMTISYWH